MNYNLYIQIDDINYQSNIYKISCKYTVIDNKKKEYILKTKKISIVGIKIYNLINILFKINIENNRNIIKTNCFTIFKMNKIESKSINRYRKSYFLGWKVNDIYIYDHWLQNINKINLSEIKDPILKVIESSNKSLIICSMKNVYLFELDLKASKPNNISENWQQNLNENELKNYSDYLKLYDKLKEKDFSSITYKNILKINENFIVVIAEEISKDGLKDKLLLYNIRENIY